MKKLNNALATAKRHISLFLIWLGGLSIHRANSHVDSPSFLYRACEQYILQIKNAITVDEYYEFGLDRREIPWFEKRQYIGQLDIQRLYRHINGMAYDAMLRNKLIFQLLCESLHIPIVPILAVYASKAEVYPRRCLRNRTDLETFLEEGPRQHLFIKKSTGKYGIGAISLGEHCGGRRWQSLPSKQLISVDELTDNFSCGESQATESLWIIQDTIRPHSELARVVAGVCPTLRIMTLNRDGQISVPQAMLRFGYGDTPVDNNISGGVPFLVDVESGLIGSGSFKVNGVRSAIQSHPKTNITISGKTVPFWSEARELALESARKLPQISYIGWDIVVTDEGPWILEANSCSGLLALQLVGGQGLLKGPLGEILQTEQGISRSGVTLLRR